MFLEIKRAFQSPFSEEKWYLKLIFPTIMSLVWLIYDFDKFIPQHYIKIITIISIIPYFVWMGFFTQFEHNEIHDEKPLLPILKTKVRDYLVLGLKATCTALFYTLIFILISIAFLLLVKISKPANIIFEVIFFILLLLFVLVASFATSCLADTFTLKSTFNISRILSLIQKVSVEIVIYILLTIALTVSTLVICFLLGVSIIGIILIPIMIAVMQLITINLKAQVYKIAKYRLENNE